MILRWLATGLISLASGGAAHADFAPLNVAELLAALKVPAADTLCAPAPGAAAEEGGTAPGQHLRLWPHRHATDGFFAAVWQRKA